MNRNLWIVTLIILALLTACGGGSSHSSKKPQDQQENNNFPPPEEPQHMRGGAITLSDNNHIINFDVEGGYIKGVVSDSIIKNEDVKIVGFGSDKVGWGLDSSVLGELKDGSVELKNTSNNDKGIWFVVLHDDSVRWFNTSQWEISGKPWTFVGDGGLVSYGGYIAPSIKFVGGQAVIDFGSNVLTGLVKNGVPPQAVRRIQWNSDRVGWMEKSSAFSGLQTNVEGNYLVVIDGMPNNDVGNFSAEMHDSSRVWFNIEAWQMDTNAILDMEKGFIEYQMF